MRPYQCIVCLGKGIVRKGFYEISSVPNDTADKTIPTESCRACNGTGVLWSYDFPPIPDHPPWIDPGDGNITSPPFITTWDNPGDDNITKPPYEITCIPSDMLSNRDDRTIVMNPRQEI